MGKLILSGKGRRWLSSGHPWVYADDIVGGEAESGELLAVEDPSGQVVGWGLHSSSSRIAVRLVTRSQEQPDRAFWKNLIASAIERRTRLGYLTPEGACRLVSGDADGVPGLVVDIYAGVLVTSCSTQAMDRMREFLVELLKECLPFAPRAIVDRSDSPVRRLEELEKRVEVIEGEMPSELVVREGELSYEVDVLKGHKTGHYLDQRENRLHAVRGVAGKEVLDAFCYDGLFGVRAALAGASSVLCLDQSQSAGERVLRNAERNGVADRVRFEKVNAMHDLRKRAISGEQYDLVVIDPPAFAKNKREVRSAERGYVELNRRGMRLVRGGGLLVTASCSYNVRAEAFRKFLSIAAWDAGRPAYLEAFTGASLDHPVLLTLPETDYLKCAFVRVEDA